MGFGRVEIELGVKTLFDVGINNWWSWIGRRIDLDT